MARAAGHFGPDLAVGGGAVWTTQRIARPETIDRFDGARGTTVRIPFELGTGIAVAGRQAWAVSQEGNVARIDAHSGRVTRRWSRLARPGVEDSSEAIVADAAGVWILFAGEGRILRLEGTRVTRTIPVDVPAPLNLARAADGLWITSGDDQRGYRLTRLDARSGRVTATVELGLRRPRALVPVKGGLWAIAGDGTVVLVDS